MKLKVALISLICVLILLPITHGAVSVYKDLSTNEEPETIEIESVSDTSEVS
jgi:hypothetical protein